MDLKENLDISTMPTEQIGEFHVCSLVVLTVPTQIADVEAEIQKLAGAEIPISDPAGKLIVTLESHSRDVLADQFNQIQQLPGVLAVTLVFHQMDDDHSVDKEVSNESQ